MKIALPFKPTAREVLAHVAGKSHELHSIKEHVKLGLDPQTGVRMRKIVCSCNRKVVEVADTQAIAEGLRNVPERTVS